MSMQNRLSVIKIHTAQPVVLKYESGEITNEICTFIRSSHWEKSK